MGPKSKFEKYFHLADLLFVVVAKRIFYVTTRISNECVLQLCLSQVAYFDSFLFFSESDIFSLLKKRINYSVRTKNEWMHFV